MMASLTVLLVVGACANTSHYFHIHFVLLLFYWHMLDASTSFLSLTGNRCLFPSGLKMFRQGKLCLYC
jgi:hypothetical protein